MMIECDIRFKDIRRFCSRMHYETTNFQQLGRVRPWKNNLPLMKGWIGDREDTVLRDTGSTGMMVKAEPVDPSQFTGMNRKLMMINSSLEEFPVAWIQVDTPVFFWRSASSVFAKSDLRFGYRKHSRCASGYTREFWDEYGKGDVSGEGSTLNAMAGERSRVRVPPCGMRCH